MFFAFIQIVILFLVIFRRKNGRINRSLSTGGKRDSLKSVVQLVVSQNSVTISDFIYYFVAELDSFSLNMTRRGLSRHVD